MRKIALFAGALLLVGVLAGCNNNDSNKNSNSNDLLVSDKNSRIEGGKPYFLCSVANRGEIRISSAGAGAEARFFAPRSSATLAAPSMTGLNGSILQGIFTERALGSRPASAQVQWALYDLENGHEVVRAAIAALPANAAANSTVYTQLGLPEPRYYSGENAAHAFFVANGTNYGLRNSSAPDQNVEQWGLDPASYIEPRWDLEAGHARFFYDRIVNGQIRSGYAYQKSDGTMRSENLPAPALRAGSVHQLGLQRYDDSRYVWMEWANGQALLRMMDIQTRRAFTLPVPDSAAGAHGPSFALAYLPHYGQVLAIPGARALQLYQLSFGALELALSVPYPRAFTDDLSAYADNPRGIVSASSDQKQLLITLPVQGMPFVFAYRPEQKRLEQVGSESCGDVSQQ